MRKRNLKPNNIQRARKIMGVSQSKLAYDLGVTRQTLSNYECGTAPVPSDIVISLCDIFRCSSDWLLRYEPNSKRRARIK
ncbi:MAG: helix-turn-helix transcriptional regulator [Bacilli bacterium]|nr:helix-turn-helix transcriptional regulator [Bacilli bacterium]